MKLAVKRLPLLHHCVYHIFKSENGVLDKAVLWGVTSVAQFINGHECTQLNQVCYFLGSTTKKQVKKFLSANLPKNVKSKLYHMEYSKTRGQTV